MKKTNYYICIDLKSFYASVECVERGLDPLTTNLVVADESRTEKTICLAVSPSLKAYGISGRARLFEVVAKVKELNAQPDIEHELTYIIAPPRMAKYMEYSTKIYEIYLKYVAPEDIQVYSVDEVFMDVTHYLNVYGKTPHELAKTIIQDVMWSTGITATAGIGTNMYLAKIAMDIEAKHTDADKDGVRIAYLDEKLYRQKMWEHTPITDFWRVGHGYANKLAKVGLYTMGDIARCTIGGPNDFYNEELLYKLFGINAELLIDHAWGYEPCTMEHVKAYRPSSNSMSSGQVLQHPYKADKARIVIYEMTDLLVLDLVDKGLVTNQLVLNIGYDIDNLTDPMIKNKYHGPITTDRYGRNVPKHAHGTVNIGEYTSSTKILTEAVLRLFDDIVNRDLLIRRMTVTANMVISEKKAPDTSQEYEQMDLFTDYEALAAKKEAKKMELDKEKKIQKAMLDIRKKYGKNAILRGTNFEEGATARMRNEQIGGHKA